MFHWLIMNRRMFEISLLLVIYLLVPSQCDAPDGSEVPYEIVLENFVVEQNDVCVLEYARLMKLDHSTIIFNASGTVLKQIPTDTIITIVAYEKKDNSYSLIGTPISTINLCKYMESPNLLYPDIQKSSNLPKTCPIKPGAFYINNYKPDTSKLPKVIPGERWRLDFTLTSRRKQILSAKVFVYIKRKKNKA